MSSDDDESYRDRLTKTADYQRFKMNISVGLTTLTSDIRVKSRGWGCGEWIDWSEKHVTADVRYSGRVVLRFLNPTIRAFSNTKAFFVFMFCGARVVTYF